MKTSLGKIICAFLLLLPICAQAASMTFTSDGTIQAGNTWTNVYIHDTPPEHTTVTMTGGAVSDSMTVNEAATFNLYGGNVGQLGAHGQSTTNITGGSMGALMVYDNATATISQNANVGIVGVYGNGNFNMNGGTVIYLTAVESLTTLNLRDGYITGYLGANSFAVVNVYGYNLAKTDIGGAYNEGQITGFWQDGSQFTINLSGCGANINLIPEPTTLLLFGIGTFLLRKSYR